DPGMELLLDAVERWQPAADKVGAVAGPEEALAAGEHIRVMLVPSEALAGTERFGDLRLRLQRAESELERAGGEDRSVGVGQRERLLLGQRVLPRRRVVLDVAASGLSPQPLLDVARCR